jgi:hypothetical protein
VKRNGSWAIIAINTHYYQLIYHFATFTAVGIEATDVILAPSVGTIARSPRTETSSSDFYHRWVNDRCGNGIFSSI